MSDSFYDLEGTEITRELLVSLMIEYFNELVGDGASSITDFNEGSEIRNLLESIAVDLFHLEKLTYDSMKVAFLKHATGDWLDLHGEELQCARDLGNYSEGVLKFTIPSALSVPVTIQSGTLVYSYVTGARFYTNIEVTIPVGSTSTIVPATSLKIGRDMNAEINTITGFVNNAPYANMTVTNESKFNNGRDLETDDEYRLRLYAIERQDTFGSLSYYQALAVKINGLHDIYMDSSTDYTKNILVNGDEKPTPDSVLAEALAVFTDKHNIVVGHNFTVNKPVYITVDFVLNLYVEELIPEQTINHCLKAMFDGGKHEEVSHVGLNIGESLNKYKMILTLENMEGITQVESILKVTTNGPATFNYIDPADNEVIKLGALTINQEVVTE